MSRSRHRISTVVAAAGLVIVTSCTVLFDYSEDQTTCAADTDCDDDNPCTDDACAADGFCQATAADHTGALPQVPSDCQQLVCQDGQPTAVADPEDLPDDPCIDAQCDGATLVQTPLPDGAACGVGSGHGVCQSGECVVACTADNAASVCNDDKPCTDDSCDLTLGRCHHTPLDGAAPMADEPGNCQALLCVLGELQSLNDDSDLPDDGNACTDDVCTDGQPSNPLLPEGTVCGDNGGQTLVCDASGNCLGCNQPTDCNGSDTECHWRTCASGQCGVANAADGTVTQDQSGTGACQERQCDGAGGTKVVNLPNGTSCDDGLYCNGGDSCTSGSCAHAGDPCDGADADGDCSELCRESQNDCNGNDPNNSNCNDGQFCTQNDKCNGSGSCVGSGNPCQGPDGDGDCSESCNENADNCSGNDPNGSSCNDGLYCTQNDTCSGGSCVGSGDPCPGPDGDGDCSESCNENANNCSANDPDGSFCQMPGSGECIAGSCQPIIP